jgi:hypothetical protein
VKDPDFTFDSTEKRENFDQDEHLEDKRPQTEDNDEDERVKTRNDVERITHKYLIVRHTENEGDSMHSCIEKERNRILKSGPLYVPSELVTIAK